MYYLSIYYLSMYYLSIYLHLSACLSFSLFPLFTLSFFIHIWRTVHIKTHGERSHLQIQKGGFAGKQYWWIPELWNCEKRFFLFLPLRDILRRHSQQTKTSTLCFFLGFSNVTLKTTQVVLSRNFHSCLLSDNVFGALLYSVIQILL